MNVLNSRRAWRGTAFLAFLVLGPLLASLALAEVVEPSDLYLRALDLIKQADSLSARGLAGPALTNYTQARRTLTELQRVRPDYSPKAVAYRLNYLAEKVASLSQNESGAAGSSASGGQVKLLEPGAEPRKPLRFHPQAGAKQSLEMTLNMAMVIKSGEAEIPAIKIPPIKLGLEFLTKTVSPQGEIGCEMTFGEATMGEAADANPLVAGALKAALTNFNGVTGSGSFSDRGISKGGGIETKAPANADPQLRQMMDQMKETFSQVVVHLPEEAVGPGAKWEVTSPIKSQGLTIDQKVTYELVSLEGERISLKTSVAQSAANQKMPNTMMPQMKMDLTKMTGKGGGELTVDLAQMAPTAANFEQHSDFSMSMEMSGQKQAMSLKLDMTAQLESK